MQYDPCHTNAMTKARIIPQGSSYTTPNTMGLLAAHTGSYGRVSVAAASLHYYYGMISNRKGKCVFGLLTSRTIVC